MKWALKILKIFFIYKPRVIKIPTVERVNQGCLYWKFCPLAGRSNLREKISSKVLEKAKNKDLLKSIDGITKMINSTIKNIKLKGIKQASLELEQKKQKEKQEQVEKYAQKSAENNRREQSFLNNIAYLFNTRIY